MGRKLILAMLWLWTRPGNPAEPAVRWSGPRVTLLGSPSRDGLRLSFADPADGGLGTYQLGDGSSLGIAAPEAGSREFAYFSVFSRDGSKIAYAWFNREGFYELRVAAAGGEGAPVTAYRNDAAGFVQPSAWTPDGRNVLTLLFRRDNISQIALIPAAGGPARVLRSLNWVYPKRMDLSPDGRWIVYDNFAVEGKPERTVFLLSVDGSDEKKLVDAPGNWLFPMWRADGRRVVFAGDTGGSQALWTVDAATGGAARGQPSRVSADLGRILPLGITGRDEVFYGVRAGAQDIVAGGRKLASRFAGRNSAPAWSPDGKRLAYLSRRGTENYGQDARAIVIQDLATGAEREVAARLAHIERIAWSPDGGQLLAAGSDGKGRSGLFLVGAGDGATSPLAARHDAPFRGFEGVWSADGKEVYYLEGEELRRRRVADGAESTLLRTPGMRHVALNPAGDALAIGIGGTAIRITPLAERVAAHLIPFVGVSDLAWGTELYAGRGTELWAVPVTGGSPRPVPSPPDRLPGIAVAPDGRTLAFAAGREQVEVRSFALPK